MLIHMPADSDSAAEARAAIVADDRLSFAALGLLLRLLENAPEWDISADTLSRMVRTQRGSRGEGRESIRSLFDELHEQGYLVRTKQRGDGGRFVTQLEAFASPQSTIDNQDSGVAPTRLQVVYVIGQPGSPVVKIGTTSRLRKRLKGVQTGSPIRLEVLWSCPGGGWLEERLHTMFAPLRLEGEWFDFGSADPVTQVAKAADEARWIDLLEEPN